MSPEVKLLRELIALPSVNPDFLEPRHPWGGEKRVCDFLASQAAMEGMDVDLELVEEHRSNLIVRLQPSGKIVHRILFAPHLDTVGSEPLQASLFEPRRSQGRIYGRGACDTKGSVAAMFCAMAGLARSKRRPAHTEIVFAGLIDEENAQKGSRAFAARGEPFDLAMVGEPTQGKVVTAHKGDVWLQLETRGRAAHGSRPELGRNAVHAMARVVDLIETQYAQELRRRSHPLLGSPSINVGSMAGGIQPNIVPAHCVATVDRRTLPGETADGAKRELSHFIRQAGLTVSMSHLKLYSCPPLETDANLPLVKKLFACAGQRRRVGVDYFCDAAVLAAGGIPSVVFGPGDIRQAHTSEEWISIQSLEQSVRVLRRFLADLP